MSSCPPGFAPCQVKARAAPVKELAVIAAVASVRPLAAAQCRALAALAHVGDGLRVPQEGGHPLQIDWRKPAFAGSADVAQWTGANARSSHVIPSMPTLQPPAAPACFALRSMAVKATTHGVPVARAPSHALPLAGDTAGQPADPFESEPGLDADEDPLLQAVELATGFAGAEPRALLPVALDDAALGALIARIAQHEDKALATLYDATSSRVFGLVGRIVVDNALAEEVVEDTFWQVWRQAVRFDADRGRPLTWLLAMARSRAIDALRRRERRAMVPLEDEELASLCDEDGAGPPDLLAATHGKHLLHRALAALEAQPRQLIALAFFRGLTHEEIAACTGLPLGTVKSQIRRSLQTLKQRLAEAGCPDMPL